jgi:NitT/TauT family transport system permease protein
VLRGVVDLAQLGLLLKHIVASLFLVTYGFVLAVITATPIGLTVGWYRRAELAFDPLVQILRPISPLAWIPIAIPWFAFGDMGAIYFDFRAVSFRWF